MKYPRRIFAFPLLIALILTGNLAASPGPQDSSPLLSRSTVPARGRQEIILTVSEFGRYAITVNSAQGTSLQLLDRMAGPGPVMGKAGETDGRIDTFLDRGEYKIITLADESGSGEAQVRVHSIDELHDSLPA